MLGMKNFSNAISLVHIEDLENFLASVRTAELDGTSARLLDTQLQFVMRKEYSQAVPRSLWGLPQGVMWTILRQYDKVKRIDDNASYAVDASAVAPTNVSSLRLHDFSAYQKTYASKRFRALFVLLSLNDSAAYAINVASLATNPEPIVDNASHKKWWRNYWDMSKYDANDYYPITFRVLTSRGEEFYLEI